MKYLILFVLTAMACENNTANSAAALANSNRQPNRFSETDGITGFNNITNGLFAQEIHDANRAVFEEVEDADDGLGPVYNATGCTECHQNPVTGGISQVMELRSGNWDGILFTEQTGGTLVNDRAINADIQELVLPGFNVQTRRTSLTLLGDGFVEAIADTTLLNIQANQPTEMRGRAIPVPILEAPGQTRIGRFGWKAQHASLVSFSADAYVNEMGITSPLQLEENTSNGRSVADFDEVAEPESELEAGPNPSPVSDNVQAFTDFIRATRISPRGPGAETSQNPDSDITFGSQIFDTIGCSICHTRTITTAPVDTMLIEPSMPFLPKGYKVPFALGGKKINPFSDFLLHDVGTGDGIIQGGDAFSRNELRTPPLWGVRTRTRMLHDGSALTLKDAITAHRNQAEQVRNNFLELPDDQKELLFKFLGSL